MRRRWRVAVIDSGVAAEVISRSPGEFSPGWDGISPVLDSIVDARSFSDDGSQVTTGPALSDALGHGTAVIAAISSGGVIPELLIAQVFDRRGVTTAATIAAALEWSVRAGADLIHMSLGLREDRPVLGTAVAEAVSSGCVLVASAPARGRTTFPAAYRGVVRATGDARCAPGEISELASAQADFGGCPRLGSSWFSDRSGKKIEPAGASVGAAHVTGFVIANFRPASRAHEVRLGLSSMARYRGAERRADHIPRSASSASTSPCSPTALTVNPGIAGPKPLPDV